MVNFPKGPCALDFDCYFPCGELQPRYKCCLCKAQIHNSVFGCSALHGEYGDVKFKGGCGRQLNQLDASSKNDEQQAEKAETTEITTKERVVVATKQQQPVEMKSNRKRVVAMKAIKKMKTWAEGGNKPL